MNTVAGEQLYQWIPLLSMARHGPATDSGKHRAQSLLNKVAEPGFTLLSHRLYLLGGELRPWKSRGKPGSTNSHSLRTVAVRPRDRVFDHLYHRLSFLPLRDPRAHWLFGAFFDFLDRQPGRHVHDHIDEDAIDSR